MINSLGSDTLLNVLAGDGAEKADILGCCPSATPAFIPCSPHGLCGAWQQELWRFSYDESDVVSRPEAEEPLVTAEGLGLSPLEGPKDFWWIQFGIHHSGSTTLATKVVFLD